MKKVNQQKRRIVSLYELHDLGISEDKLKMVNTLEELKLNPPNIVIASCVKDIGFIQNHSKLQVLKKKNQYVMSLGVYNKLRYDEQRNIKILKPGKFKFKNVYKPYNGEDLSNKTIIFQRSGGLGDLLFINPVIRHLKKLYPTCNVKFACSPQYQPMVQNFKEIDEILDLPYNAKYLFESDYMAIFEGVIERTKEAEKMNAYHLFSKSLNLNIPDEDLIPQQGPNIEITNQVKEILKKWNILDDKFILMQIRASTPIRTPRPEFWKNIINYLTDKNYNVIITDSPHQKDKIDKFINELKNKDKVFNFVEFSKTINYTISLASLAELCVGVDSSLNHISRSVDTKSFGIFGSFTGKIRLDTYGDLCDWIEPDKNLLNCCPCFKHTNKPCINSINGYPICYDKIDMDKCLEKIDKLLNCDGD